MSDDIRVTHGHRFQYVQVAERAVERSDNVREQPAADETIRVLAVDLKREINKKLNEFE